MKPRTPGNMLAARVAKNLTSMCDYLEGLVLVTARAPDHGGGY